MSTWQNACQYSLCLITYTYQTQKKTLKHKNPFMKKLPETSNDQQESQNIDFASCSALLLNEADNDYGLKADDFNNKNKTPNTDRATRGDIKYFHQWAFCVQLSPSKISEETILKFIFHHLEEMPFEVEEKLISGGFKRFKGLHSLATVKRRLVSVTIFCKKNGLDDPCNTQKIKDTLSTFARIAKKQKKGEAITKEVLDTLVLTCNTGSLLDIRDKALLLFGFSSGGRRRSEISDADMEDLKEHSNGDFTYRIARSKTDQIGEGHLVPVKGRAAIALKEWLKASGVNEGKIFRSVKKGGVNIGANITPTDINRIVKKRCRFAEYDETTFSAHSLRSGFITEAGKQGCPLGDTMHLSDHKSVTIAMRYYQAGNIHNNKAANLAD